MERMKALVINDEQIVLDSIKRILSQENFDVDIALLARAETERRNLVKMSQERES